MSDPITTVVTVISEHPQTAAAVASIYGVAKPFLAKIFGPGADELGEIGRDYIKEFRAKNTERLLVDTEKMLAKTGREPQQVPPNVGIPLFEAASLQDEPSLAKKWAALLANASDSAHAITITSVHVGMLRLLTSAEARFLDKLFASADKKFQDSAASYSNDTRATARKEEATDYRLLLDDIYCELMQLAKKDFNKELRQPFDAMLDNFVRQQIIMIANSEPTVTPFSPYNYKPNRSGAFFTSSGYDFMLAVTPPTKS
jgi:hypothetical protein